MIICHQCKKVMPCQKTGAEYHFQNGHCYAADTFKCNDCGNEIAVTSSNPHQVDEEGRGNLKSHLGDYFVEMVQS